MFYVFSADCRLIANCNRSSEVVIWQVTTGEELVQLQLAFSKVCSLAFTEDGHQLVAGSLEGQVFAWNIRDKPELVEELSLPNKIPVLAVCWCAAANKIVASSDEGFIGVWNIGTRELENLLGGPANSTCRELLQLTSKHVAANYGSEVWIWDVVTRKPVKRLPAIESHIGGWQPPMLTTIHQHEYQFWNLETLFQ